MARISVALRGGEQLAANLRELDRRLQRRIVTNSLRTAMNQVLKPAVVAASPVGKTLRRTVRKTKMQGLTLGPLRKAWSVIKARASRGNQVRVVLKSNTRTRDAFYAIFLEGGWLSGRRITKREVRRALKTGSKVRGRTAVPARPFVRPTAEAQFQNMVDGVAAATSAQVEVAMREIHRG